jgi:hypothetical protein
MSTDNILKPIDCACVIHGDSYDWSYVDRLYNMLNRNISVGIRLHVYTEPHRSVPMPMIKHELVDWKLKRPKHGWWYKMQLFNPEHHAGSLLYFDLDTVIVKNIDWIWQQPLTHFWTVKDFKYLWKPTHNGINSSVMWWDTQKFRHVWDNFAAQDLDKIVKQYHGDQDFLNIAIQQNQRRFFDTSKVQSWRWECHDGGYDFRKRRHKCAGAGTQMTDLTSVMVFHGRPKPSEISDAVIFKHWQ